jgi:hypothetical protein
MNLSQTAKQGLINGKTINTTKMMDRKEQRTANSTFATLTGL